MRNRLVLAVAVMALTFTACGGSDSSASNAAEATEAPVPTSSGDIAHGIEIYAGACVACHGLEGAGIEGLGKPWVDSEFINARSDDEMLVFLIEGRPSDHPENTTGIAMMPRAGNPSLTDSDLLDLIAYMRTLNFSDEAAVDGSANAAAVDEVPAITSPGADAVSGVFPILGLTHPEARFTRGAAAVSNSGPDYELEWRIWGGVVEISAHPAQPDVFAVNVESQTSPGATIRGLVIRGVQGYQFFMPNAYPDYTVMWYENGAMIRLRLGGLDDRAEEVIGALSVLTNQQVAELTGGWIDAIDS